MFMNPPGEIYNRREVKRQTECPRQLTRRVQLLTTFSGVGNLPLGASAISDAAERALIRLLVNRFNAMIFVGHLQSYSRLHFFLNDLRLFGHEKQGARHYLPDLFAFPPPLHNSRTRVTVRAK
jgi:hypothetical protein